jgi:PleD family two-component response regulator
MSDRLSAAGFEVATAVNGEEALRLLEKQWFPVVLTDWQMPVMNGIQLVERLREHGGDDSYFIMLSIRAASDDFERGYCAGVDDYLSKKSTDTEILARIEAGLNTVALRRSLRQSRAALVTAQSQVKQLPLEPKAELLGRLQSELVRAKRYKRPCSILMLGVVHRFKNPEDRNGQAEASANVFDEPVQADYMQVLRGVIRIDIDSVVLFDIKPNELKFAIVLPETGPAEVSVIRSRVRNALEQRLREHESASDTLEVSVGAASLDPTVERATLSADELIVAAENCRRCMASNGARRLAAVQSSVVCQVAIPCRYGYAVADHCLELDHRYAAERPDKSSAA